MSRAYRIRVRETVRRVIRASDHVSTQLELLDLLPAGEMAALLADELRARGFEQSGEVLVRRSGPITVTVDPQAGSVTVASEAAQNVTLESEKEGRGYDDFGQQGRRQAEETLRREAREQMEREAGDRRSRLQREVTDRLEAELLDLQAEVNGVVNRVTAEALKRKAARLGQIKELTEDPQSGSLTIVLEV